MKPRIAIIMILALVLTGVFASVAWGGSITAQIINDASDGTVNGHYTAAQVRAALAAVESDSSYSQYSDVAGVLQDYLASLTTTKSATPTPKPSTTATGATQTAAGSGATVPTTPQGVALDYTGGQPLVAFALGGALVIAGAVLRRRWA